MKHPREPQGAQEHGHVFRVRREGRGDSSSDDEEDDSSSDDEKDDSSSDDEEETRGDGDNEAPADDAMEEDGVDPDEAWHTKKGLTFVEVGKRFEVGGREYQRTAERGAKCTTCEHPFGKHSYNLRALGAHATKCLRIAADKARRALAGAAAAWTGTVSCTHTFDGGHAVTVAFAKVVVDGKNALQCQSCDTELLQTAEYFQERHVQSRHVPELVKRAREVAREAAAKAAAKKKAEDERGSAAQSFFASARAKGKELKAQRDERQAEVDKARETGDAPPAPPSPLPLADTASPLRPRRSTEPPPLVPNPKGFIDTLQDHVQGQADKIVELERALARRNFDDGDDDEDEPPETEKSIMAVCRGVKLDLPGSVGEHYPHALRGSVGADLEWTAPDDDGRVRARGRLACLGVVKLSATSCGEPLFSATSRAEPQCGACERLQNNTKLRKLVRRACDPNIASSNTEHQYLNFSQLQTRLKDRRSQYRDQSLRALTATSKVRSLTKVATSFNRVVAALATKKLPRLHIVARRLLERGSTHRVVVRQMERAVEGYIPKGDFERIDYQKAYVALSLGGRRALRLEMADDGGPSRRTLTRQKVYDVPRFIACAGLLQVQSLLENMEKTFGARPPKPGEERALFHLAIDNVNLEERLRYAFGDERTGGLRIARESSFDGDLTIKSEEDVERITAAFDEAELLLPKEATVAVLIKNDDSMCDSSVERERVFGGVSRGRGGCRSARGPIAARLRGLPRRRAGPSATARSRAECQSKHPACSREITPVFMSGTAKPSGYGKAAQDQAWIVEKVIEIWNEKYIARGPIASVPMDGDSTNVKTQAVAGLLDDMPEGQLRDLLSQLPLVDLTSNADFVAATTDDQHNGKNIRSKLSGSGGFRLSGIHFDRSALIDILHIFNGTAKDDLEKILPPPKVDDKQNVDSMVSMMKELSRLRGLGVADAKTELSDVRKVNLNPRLTALQPLALLAATFTFLLTDNKSDLSAHVANMGEMATVLFVMKRHSPGCLAAQTVRSIARSITSHIKCIARAQILKINQFYLFADATHLLEQLFGILRTLCGPQRNFDMVQLEDRISTVVRLYEIYLERPEWRENARRFGESTDHWNTRSWSGSVDPSLVNLKNSWALGQKRAITALRKCGVNYAGDVLNITRLIKNNPRISLLNWDGTADAAAAADDDDA